MNPGSPHGVPRREVLIGASSIAGLAALGTVAGAAPAALAASGPSTPLGVANLALSLVGYTRSALSGIVTESPWVSYGIGNAWCAWFGSWLTRGAGVGYETFASAFYAEGTPVSTPAIGDICYYDTIGHAGVVVGVNNGVAELVEGNAGDDPGIVKYRAAPFAPCQFSRPTGYQSETIGDVEMRVIFNTDNPVDATRRAIVGETTFEVITGAESTPERKLWGTVVNVSQSEWTTIFNDVNERRGQNGLSPL